VIALVSPDQTFQRVLIAACAVVFPVALYFRVRSQMTREKLDRRQEGWFILLTLRPAGLACAMSILAYMINPSNMAWSAVALPLWLRWMGVVVWGSAVVLIFWTFRNLGRNLTDTVVTRKQHTLITSGPYRWVRHPFYDCVLLMTVGASLMAANWFMFLTGVAVFVFMAIRVQTEERKLLERFGEPYAQYVGRTGRFLPKLGS
jgi:protein-S-isoprenylcysteine O-methyltransferase Ste14